MGSQSGLKGATKLTLSLYFLVFCLCFLAFQSCSEKPTDRGFRSAFVTGSVTDSLSGSPIDSAIISLADTLFFRDSIYTDTSGFYLDFAGAQGLYRPVYCRKTGYQPQKKIVDLVRDTTKVDFNMSP